MLIGLLGKKYSGKDTIADYLVKKYGYSKKAFADPLKKCVKELFGFTDEQLYTEKKEEKDSTWNISPRKIFQILGTDIMRNPKLLKELGIEGPEFWIKRFDIWYKNNFQTHEGFVVVSDVRFQNEVDYIMKNHGIVFKIVRNNSCSELGFPKELEQDNHVSEIGIDDIKNYSYIIDNNGSLEELYKKIII